MQRFSLDRRRFAGHPRRGFPRPPGGSPSPSKSPPEGGDRTPKGRGRAAPLSGLSAAPSTPLGHPYGVPPASPAPPPVPVRQRKGGKRSAQGRQPRRGVGKKSKWWRRSRPPGRQRWKCGEGGAVGGQGWGQPVGSPPGCPRGVPASVHGPAKPPTGRAAISTSPRPGGPTRPPLGACFAPQGSRLPFRKSSEYTCLSSGPPEARF